MKVTYTNILIDRDAMTKIPKVVPAWEVPVFQSLYGEDHVDVGDDVAVEVDYEDVPEAKDVFARLASLYGGDADSRQSHVTLAYGVGRAGEKLLQDAINAAHGVGKGKASAKPAAGDDK